MGRFKTVLAERKLLAAVAVGVLGAFFLWWWAGRGWLLTVNGESIGVVASPSMVTMAVSELVRSQPLPQQVKLRDNISYRRLWWPSRQVLSLAELKDRLHGRLSFYAEAVAVEVNGQPRFFFADEAAAQAFLQEVRRLYTVRPEFPATFAEKVQLARCQVPLAKLLTPAAALQLVRQGERVEEKYVIKEGDNFWDLARQFGVSVEDISAWNPGLDSWHLQPGQELRLVRERPYLTLVQRYTERREEELPFPVQKEYTTQLPPGKVEVVQEGAPGKCEKVYQVVAQNGMEVSRDLVETKELSPPQARVEKVGQGIMLASRGGGRSGLVWPASGPVTSPFGPRWGGFHTGIDIGAPYGAPVVAAAGGRVIRAGWYAGYGETVDIDHGGGVVTRYAHLSAIYVGVGEQVAQGQRLGCIGMTGRATGPHLHFEVICDGAPRDPLRYLP
ncbi:peptidoglycan DD-metalloendopeptidase family protein [Desulfothermobacter acidiphilus]|uniref:peptidoglycan DD-metalloendopeptidase family protein n=1 Tax=Desulfothermobacter acidiphilus TaxID=1938353 RepID=UPI003F8A8E25